MRAVRANFRNFHNVLWKCQTKTRTAELCTVWNNEKFTLIKYFVKSILYVVSYFKSVAFTKFLWKERELISVVSAPNWFHGNFDLVLLTLCAEQSYNNPSFSRNFCKKKNYFFICNSVHRRPMGMRNYLFQYHIISFEWNNFKAGFSL